eukprot:762949-Hanusia_phi.AAC.12
MTKKYSSSVIRGLRPPDDDDTGRHRTLPDALGRQYGVAFLLQRGRGRRAVCCSRGVSYSPVNAQEGCERKQCLGLLLSGTTAGGPSRDDEQKLQAPSESAIARRVDEREGEEGMQDEGISGVRCGMGLTFVEDGRLKINHISKDYISASRSFTDSPSTVLVKIEMRKFTDDEAAEGRPRTPSPFGVQREGNHALEVDDRAANSDGIKFAAEVEEICLFFSDHDLGAILSVVSPSSSLERQGEQGVKGVAVSDQQEDGRGSPVRGGGGAGLSILLRGTLLDIQTGYKGLACRVEVLARLLFPLDNSPHSESLLSG